MDSNRFIESLSILDIWHALGGGPTRRRRGRAFWRRGDGYSVALHPEKGCWFDFVSNEGGGILRLVEVALGCDRKAALEWVADYAGVPLHDTTPAERRDYARRRNAAEIEARALTEYRQRCLAGLREWHDTAFRMYHYCKRRILAADYSSDATLSWLMEEGERCLDSWESAEAMLDMLRAASWADLLVAFRENRERVA